jgi:hypothetical protein
LKKGKSISFDYFYFFLNNKKIHILHNLYIGRWKHNKRSQWHQSKSFFSRTTHDMCHFFCWFITLKFIFWILNLTMHVSYKYVLITNWFYIIYIMHWCPLLHKYEQLLLRVKSMFEPNVLKLVIKTIFINSSSFAFLIINIKILIYNSLEGMVHIWF